MTQACLELGALITLNYGAATNVALVFPSDTTEAAAAEAATQIRRLLHKAEIATCEPVTTYEPTIMVAIDLTEPVEGSTVSGTLRGTAAGPFQVVVKDEVEMMEPRSALLKLI